MSAEVFWFLFSFLVHLEMGSRDAAVYLYREEKRQCGKKESFGDDTTIFSRLLGWTVATKLLSRSVAGRSGMGMGSAFGDLYDTILLKGRDPSALR